MNLILCDCNPILCTEWEKNFRDEPKVQIVCGDFKSVPEYDCIISPANSFGIMDGGFDLALVNYFGQELMERVQDKIRAEYAGEQPIGTCLIVETGNKKHPYLAHTPTMRIPRIIKEYDTIYNAMRAMLLEVRKYPDIKTVLCTGLGTATGKVSPIIAARQMYLAYKNVMQPSKQIDWNIAVNIEQKILDSLYSERI
ncbi:macro domain-containing protein [Megamonas hypermegale]|uniref:macro domain-containing protein n=1 Tax=Megamonas hypermegale TaxID=158847 RepID=UPI0026F28802|nr:macro domain-containing protein [Megamonas hypermegale]